MNNLVYFYEKRDPQSFSEYLNQYIVFSPNQIKSIDNRSTFDSNNPNIYWQGSVIEPINEDTIRQFSNEAKKLYNDVKQGKAKKKNIGFGKVKNWLVDISRKFNLNIDGYKHIVDSDGFIHINKRHAKEQRTEQVDITDEDIALIPQIVSQPNYLVCGIKSARGFKTIGYIRQFSNGATYYVEEVWGKQKELAAKTMYKKEGGEAADEIISSLIHTSETTPSTATIVPVVPINISQSDTNVNPIDKKGIFYAKEEFENFMKLNAKEKRIKYIKDNSVSDTLQLRSQILSDVVLNHNIL